ncbi:hypothetical protein FB566_5087 [Stackebrandtia endophytica]|uniref:Uncharacterized protein n=1 Tax=Stackebrandtia endophytica TaxID=1496996 RepID=A0A543B3S2_9ACTN|nr:hypothetical protein FB566_5087 [Stackebrandtia endophytica]
MALPRGMVIADAWSQLSDAVAPLSNSSGRPLARTVKLILDPLVLRPVQNPRFAGSAVDIEHVDDLRTRIREAGPVLAATAAWYQLVKRTRRKAGVTDGNPQDLYFQRCFELAHLHGTPDQATAAAELAAELVEDVRSSRGNKTVEQLRGYITDPGNVPELNQLLGAAWRTDRRIIDGRADLDARSEFLAVCATAPDSEMFHRLTAHRVGTHEANELTGDGVARDHGLSRHRRVAPPRLGDRASKTRLPPPFDRSILERAFASFTAVFHRESMADIPALIRQEIHRSAGAWQLAEEPSRVAMVLGRDATADLTDPGPAMARGDARARLRSRWQRQAYVHRVLRLPDRAAPGLPEDLRTDVRHPRRAYLRRLWVRLHGREMRGESVTADAIWDLLDGVLRSVIMDQRDRLKDTLGRGR